MKISRGESGGLRGGEGEGVERGRERERLTPREKAKQSISFPTTNQSPGCSLSDNFPQFLS